MEDNFKIDDTEEKMKNGMDDFSNDTMQKLKGFSKKTKENLKMAQEKVHIYIKENPEKSAAIAAGVGVIIGSIITMSMLAKMRNRN